MPGVDSKAEIFCFICKKKTVHETSWDSEFPGKLFIKCTECKASTVERC